MLALQGDDHREVDVRVVPALDDRYGVVLNVQRGTAMRFECHVGSNPLTGLLFCTEHLAGAGGELVFAHDPAAAQRHYEEVLPAIVFVMQSLDALTCYGKRIAAWRMGFEVQPDRGIAPSAFGLECAKRFADSLGPYKD